MKAGRRKIELHRIEHENARIRYYMVLDYDARKWKVTMTKSKVR